MARISILTLWVWTCPACEMTVKDWRRDSAMAWSEVHMRAHPDVGCWSDPVRTTWAFHVVG